MLAARLPNSLRTPRLRIATDDEPILRPRQRHVQPPRIVQEADALVPSWRIEASFARGVASHRVSEGKTLNKNTKPGTGVEWEVFLFFLSGPGQKVAWSLFTSFLFVWRPRPSLRFRKHTYLGWFGMKAFWRICLSSLKLWQLELARMKNIRNACIPYGHSSLCTRLKGYLPGPPRYA